MAELVAEVQARQATRLVLCNPNNPTGAWFTQGEILQLLRALAHLEAIVIDESFIDFSTLSSAAPLALDGGNLVVVKSLGKSLGWHGVRLGYAVAGRDVASALRAQLPWWNVNGVAAFVLHQLGTCASARAAYAASFARIAEDRRSFAQRLQQVPGLTVFPSQANFLYVELPSGVSGRVLRAELLNRYGLFVRECGNKMGSSEAYLRLAVLPPEACERLTSALTELLPELVAFC